MSVATTPVPWQSQGRCLHLKVAGACYPYYGILRGGFLCGRMMMSGQHFRMQGSTGEPDLRSSAGSRFCCSSSCCCAGRRAQ